MLHSVTATLIVNVSTRWMSAVICVPEPHFPSQHSLWYLIYRVRHKSVNTPLSHERLVGGLQDGGRGTHVTHFVQLYPQPLYTASQVRMTWRSWDEGVLTDLCLTGVLTDLCLTLYLFFLFQLYEKYKSEFEENLVKKTDSLMKEIEAMFPRLAVLDMMDDADNIREYIGVSLINLFTKF